MELRAPYALSQPTDCSTPPQTVEIYIDSWYSLLILFERPNSEKPGFLYKESSMFKEGLGGQSASVQYTDGWYSLSDRASTASGRSS